MARHDRPAGNTTTGPGVPGPRRYPTAPGDTGRSDTGQGDSRGDDAAPPEGNGAPWRTRASADYVLEHTRLAGIWLAAGCFLVVLVLLLVFIALNESRVNINFFGAHADVYLGVALVLAAACGAFLVMFAGMARIMQLRSRTRKRRRTARKAAGR